MNEDQIKFIEAKVKELGSIKAVKAHYNKVCEVDKYANKYAKKVFKEAK